MEQAEEDYSGIPCPVYHGRLSQDWSFFEHRQVVSLRAWLRVKNIPLHSREAKDVLYLALEPGSTAAFAWEHACKDVAPRDFDDGAALLRKQFDNLTRRKLAQHSALNELDVRFYRSRGRRREFVKDLVADVEVLFQRAEITDDAQKRDRFIKCFVEFPSITKALSKIFSYEACIAESIRWEAVMIARENDLLNPPSRTSQPQSTPTKAHRPVPPGGSRDASPNNPTPGSWLTSTTVQGGGTTSIPAFFFTEQPHITASALSTPAPDCAPTTMASSSSPSAPLSRPRTLSASAPSTIDESSELERELFARPDNPTPDLASSPNPFRYPVGPDNSGVYKFSFTPNPPGWPQPHHPGSQGHSRQRSMGTDTEMSWERSHDYGARSQSVDLSRVGFGRTSGGFGEDEEEEEAYKEAGRSASTPPFVNDAIQGDGNGNGQSTSAGHVGDGADTRARQITLADLIAPRPARRTSKLVKRSNGNGSRRNSTWSSGGGSSQRGGYASSVGTSSTATATKRASDVVKGWFGGGSRAKRESSANEFGGISGGRDEDVRERPREELEEQGMSSVSEAPTTPMSSLGRPAKVRGGGLHVSKLME